MLNPYRYTKFINLPQLFMYVWCQLIKEISNTHSRISVACSVKVGKVINGGKGKWLILLVWIGLLLSNKPLYAAWDSFEDGRQIQLHGFATQGYIKTDKNNLFGDSDGRGSLDFREIGVVASLKPTQKSSFAMQLLSRTAGESNSGEIDLDFAIFDYRLVDKMTHNLGSRIGRIKNPYGLFNDTRDMAFTRQNILLPQSIYFERTRDLSLSSDGVELYSQLNRNFGYVNFQFVVSKPRVDGQNTERAILQSNRPGEFLGNIMYLGRILLNSMDDKLTLAYSEVQLGLVYQPEEDETGFNGDADFDFNLRILSAQLKYDAFILTAEYARRSFKFSGMSTNYVPTFLASTTGESYYAQLTYLLNSQWRVYTRYDVLYQSVDDKYGREYVERLADLGVTGIAYTRYAKDYLIGAQWNINSNWMLRAELHEVEGVAWVSLSDNPQLSETSKFWRAAMFSVSYRF